MIEEALVQAILGAVPDITVWPVVVPENVKPPFCSYYEVDSDTTEGHSVTTETSTFTVQVAARRGLEPEDYRQNKLLARRIKAALQHGFDAAGVCVYIVTVDKATDYVSTDESVFWTRANYSLTYDLPNEEI